MSLVTACGPGAVEQDSLRSSVFQVFCLQDGRVVGHGTGFLVAPNVLATNRHVVLRPATAQACAELRIRPDDTQIPVLGRAGERWRETWETAQQDLKQNYRERLAEFVREQPEARSLPLEQQNAELYRWFVTRTQQRSGPVWQEADAALQRRLAAIRSLPHGTIAKMSQASESDWALVRAAGHVPGTPVVLGDPENLRDGDQLIAVGYPSKARELPEGLGAGFEMKATITMGAISNAHVGTQLGRLVQHQAKITEGNSGGPSFDRCGRAYGLNTFGQQEDIYEYMIPIDAIFAALASVQGQDIGAIRRSVDRYTWLRACDPEGNSQKRTYTALALVAAIAAVSARRRRARTQRAAGVPEPVARIAARLIGVSGEFRGRTVPITAEPLVLGRSPQEAGLLFRSDCPGVSHVHCRLRLDPQRAGVLLEDLGSTYGTLVEPGGRLAPRAPLLVSKPCRVFIGSREQEFQLQLDLADAA